MTGNRKLTTDWSKFKSSAKGKMLEKAKNSYIEFCQMLDEIGFELISDYVNNQEKVGLVYKLDKDIKLYVSSDKFRIYTYKTIINFKNNLVNNKDEFIRFIRLSGNGSLVAKFKTFDGGIVNTDIASYNSFSKSRQDFYSRLKEVNGCTDDNYIGKEIKMNIYIGNVRLNPMSPHTFKNQTYKSITNFKNNLKGNNDEFIKFIGLTSGGNLIAQIKTYDGGEVEIDIGTYSKFSKSRREFYSKLKEINGCVDSHYASARIKVGIYINNMKLNSMTPDDFKASTYKSIINFKKELKKNNDVFIKFVRLASKGSLVAKIKTFDGGEIEIDITRYKMFVDSRKNFYDTLKEVNGYTKDCYKGVYVKIDIFIDDVKLNPVCPNTFKRTNKVIVNFKEQLSKNNDKFIKFVKLTNNGNLVAQIKTFDDENINIDIGAYSKWDEGRKNTYNYCKSKGYKILSPYINTDKDKILIDFNCGHEPHWIIPHNLKKDTECPICRESKGEKAIRLYLEKSDIDFIQEYRFDDCKHKRSLPFDFYIPSKNLCIEFDGIQHFEIKFGFNDEEFKLTQIRDKIKTDYCKDNNINLLRIPYYNINSIEDILDKEFDRLRELNNKIA